MTEMTSFVDARRHPSSRLGERTSAISQLLLIATLSISLSPSPAFAATLGTVTLVVILLQTARLGSLRIIGPLVVLCLLVVGMVGLSWSTPSVADVTRDIFSVLRVVVLLLVGSLICQNSDGPRVLIRAFVLAGSVEALLHIYRILANVSSFSASLYVYREETGQGSLTEVFALACLILWKQARFNNSPIPRFWRWFFFLLIGTSLLLYFSRTMIIGVLVVAAVAAAVSGIRSRRSASATTARIFVVGAILLTLFGLALLVLPTLSSGPIADLLLKFQNSIVELIPNAAQSQTEITQNYRAYESYRAIYAFSSGAPYQQLFGYGWGYSVDLVVDTASSRSETSRISAPVLHNGYLFVLVKAGLVGVALYALLLLVVARHAWRASASGTEARLIGAIGVGAVVLTTATTFVIGGLITSAGFNSTLVLLGATLSVAPPRRDDRPRSSRGDRANV